MASHPRTRRRTPLLLAASAAAACALGVASTASADARAPDEDVLERAPNDTLDAERFKGRVPLRQTLDHQMAVSGPDREVDADYFIELGKDLNTDEIELPRCGVLRLYDEQNGGVPRWISLEVQTAPDGTKPDTVADIGNEPGEKVLMLYPPDPAWTTGYMFVSFQCDGEIDVEYPVWVLTPLESVEESGTTSDPVSGEDGEGDTSFPANAGCAARPGPASGGLAIVAAMLAVGAIRRRAQAGRRRIVR